MYFKPKYNVTGFVEKTQDSRENPRGLSGGHMLFTSAFVSSVEVGKHHLRGELSGKSSIFSCMLSDHCLCVHAERQREREYL